jgi:subtilisin family serine protease
MKKHFAIALLFLVHAGLMAQIAPNKYYVQFTDKDNSPYSLNNPSEYLSDRAIERRVAQGIPIDMKDLPVNPQYIQGVEQAGAVILNPTKWLNGVTIFTSDPAVLDVIEALPYVAGVTRSNPSVNTAGQPSEKSFFSSENYNQEAPVVKNGYEIGAFDYGISFNQIQMLKGDQMHEMGYRGQGKVIAVLDAGFLNANTLDVFDSLWINDQVLGTWDFVEGEEVSFDEHPHGSMVLSTMGGNVPGQLIGTAPKASYWLLRSEDGGSEYIIEEYNWVSAAEYADMVGADIINSSLGYTTFDDPTQNHTYSELNGDTAPATIGADVAASRGMLVVNSLGNEGSGSWYYLSVPSDGDSVMGIGAVDANGNYASFSSHGPSADGRVKPDVATQGSGVYCVDPYSGQFTFAGGTSFSSPILAGMAACLWQANPEHTNMQIADAIRQSASQYLSPDDFLGHGIPDFMQANNILTVIDGPDASAALLEVFPNPFTDEIRIQSEGNRWEGSLEITVSDITGKKIAEKRIAGTNGMNEIRISDLGNLNAGVYMVQVKFSSGNIYTTKLLKK